MNVEWPLRGRREELDEIVALLDDGRSVVLHGPAGVGKSRLAAEAAVVVGERQRRHTRRITGTAGAAVPLAAVSALLGGSSAADALAGVAATLSEGVGVCVLHVDDAHHLDDASATVLHQLLEGGQVTIVATRRTGEVLRPPAAALLASTQLVQVPVEALGRDAVVDLLGTVLGGPVEGGTAHRLADICQGNPLYLRELVEGSLASGTLAAASGMWRLTGLAEGTPLLDDLVDGRLAPLDPPSREVLEVVALAEPVPLDLLAAVAPDDRIEELERAGLLVVRDDGGGLLVSTAHPLHAERLLARLPATTRRRLSRALAAVAAPHGVGVGDELRAVVWHLDGGVPLSPERLMDGARAAFDAGDTASSARLAVASFAAGGGTPAALLGSWCLAEVAEVAAADEVLVRAVDAATDARELAFLRMRQAEVRWWHDRAPAAALALLADAESAGPVGADFAAAQRGVFRALDGDAAGAEGACRHLATHRDPWVDTTANLALGLADVLAGRVQDAAARAASAYERALAAPPSSMNGDPGVHVAVRAYGTCLAGRLDEADELARLVYDVAVTRPGRQARAWGAMLRGEVALARGLPLDAQRWFVESEVGWADGDLPGPARWCAIGCALALAFTGRPAEVEATLERADGYDGTGFAIWDGRYARAALWAAHLRADGRVPAMAREQVARARGVGAHQEAMDVAHDAWRLGHRDLAVELLGGDGLQGLRAEALRAIIVGSHESDLRTVEDAAAALEAAGCLLDAAEAMAQVARGHRAAGRVRPAERAAARSGVLAARCPGASTPALAERRSTTVISARELQVARLAAEGMTNRGIAEHLVVSERTVENHLYRAFTKLGIGSRDELAEALPPA